VPDFVPCFFGSCCFMPSLSPDADVAVLLGKSFS